MAEVKDRIEKLLNENTVILFMKGTITQPQCGFSAKAIAILQDLKVQFLTVDVLEDQEIREGIKAYGNWPTIPQLYIKKQLVGGSDIMTEMYGTGELKQLLT